jgi:peptidoglycan/LPS O-acetylase OafA/YrhL
MDENRHLDLTFVGRTYMILLYVVATVFLLLVLGALLNNVGESPNQTYNLYFALALWVAFVSGGIVYEWHRMVFKRMGMQLRSVRILLPLVFLLIVGVIVILVSESPFEPAIRLIISIIIVIAFWILWKAGTMALKGRLKSVREKEF